MFFVVGDQSKNLSFVFVISCCSLILLHLIKICKCIALLSAPMRLTVHIVTITIVTEEIVACFNCFPFGKIIVMFALAEEALWLTVAVVAHADVSVAVGPLTIKELREIITIWLRWELWEKCIHINSVIILRC